VIGLITWGAGFAVAFVTTALVGLAGAVRPGVTLAVVAGVPTLFSAHVLRRHRDGNWSRAEQIAFVLGALVALGIAMTLFAASITQSRPPVV
jgi:cell division protein FtsX